jgi:hypothetical protein
MKICLFSNLRPTHHSTGSKRSAPFVLHGQNNCEPEHPSGIFKCNLRNVLKAVLINPIEYCISSLLRRSSRPYRLFKSWAIKGARYAIVFT